MSILPDTSLYEKWISNPNSEIRSDCSLIRDLVYLTEQLLQTPQNSDTTGLQSRIAFHCLSTAIQIGLRVLDNSTLSSDVKAKSEAYLINILFPRLEDLKKSLINGTLNEKEDLKEMQNMAVGVFKVAENQQMSGRANKDTVKSYTQCYTLIQCVKECDSNSEPRVFNEKLINISKEAKLRKAIIMRCLKEGKPIPAPDLGQTTSSQGSLSDMNSIDSELKQMLVNNPSGSIASLSTGLAPTRQISTSSRVSGDSFQSASISNTNFAQVSRTSTNESTNSSASSLQGSGLFPGTSSSSSSTFTAGVLSGIISNSLSSLQVSRSSSDESSNITGASASASKGFLGNVALADAHEYSKFVVTALKFEKNPNAGLHFAVLALNSIRQSSPLRVSHATKEVTDDAIQHACAAKEALAGGNKVMTQPEIAIKELLAVIHELSPGSI
jgi:hypothetical protein